MVQIGIEQKQVQTQVLGQQLQQALFLLKMNALELNEYLKQAATDNPVLELLEMHRPLQGEVFRVTRGGKVSSVQAPDAAGRDVAGRDTLKDDLKKQLGALRLEPQQKHIALTVVESLDHKGYFSENLGELANFLQVSRKEAEVALKTVQALEPAGVGARNVQECLTLQLMRRKVKVGYPYEIIRGHMRNLAQGKIKEIARALKISEGECAKYCDMVRALNPSINSMGDGEAVQYVQPEITVVKKDEKLRVALKEERLPRLSLNAEYKGLEHADEETKAYLKERYREANRMIGSLELWKTTVRKVAEAVVSAQEAFFLRDEPLRPMRLCDVAEELDMNVSTVSRAAAGKYLISDAGVYPLKHFFVRSFRAKEQTVSSDHICRLIREMLTNDVSLSDTELTKRLVTQGIGIARRTVAKYRMKMGIDSVYHRV
ncbi:MAG: RNA polymerase factor sigma-54 [Christensenella sp.]|uniref:RNA polymerase factor sigma-54 n=1 Tax=Christensenella sp. TaxID=1935934 RepID=UPI002B2092D1|nr:RNA polymerase factor sigma-54 [Christensenella sp.]MEA5002137.1 RNA polymerase factor sigma-54 [Christensenella sp.]